MNQALLSKQATEDNTPFPYGTIHAEIPESSPAAAAISSVREEIAEEDLAGRGRNIGPPHITLRYGIEGDDIAAIEALLATQSPIAATLGATSSFPPSATREVAVIIATMDGAVRERGVVLGGLLAQ
jgi:2'-5' RNA ligase